MPLNQILDTVAQAMNGHVRPAVIRRTIATLQKSLPKAVDEAAVDTAADYLAAVGHPAISALEAVIAVRNAAASGHATEAAIDSAVAASADVAHALGVDEQRVLALTTT
ncbi:hypothetical protein ACFWVM_29295 [Nocardia fluminea]|uniref:hypothetical protein n=1 Tax=Nocardia fluminea TaxID=134984 RepID=UPI003652A15A